MPESSDSDDQLRAQILKKAATIKALRASVAKMHAATAKKEDKLSRSIVSLSMPKLDPPSRIASYKKIVKASGGLTSLRPSCVQAMQAVEKNLSQDNIGKAAKALKQHIDEVTKEAKNDKSTSKPLAKFTSSMEALIKNLNAFAAKDRALAQRLQKFVAAAKKIHGDAVKLESASKSLLSKG